jgi:hypothetical protein
MGFESFWRTAARVARDREEIRGRDRCAMRAIISWQMHGANTIGLQLEKINLNCLYVYFQ